MSKDLRSETECAEDDLPMAMPLGTIFQLADGTISGCNASALSILGYTIEQLQGRSYTVYPWQTIHVDGSPYKSESHPAMVALKTKNKSENVVMGFYKPDGELIWLSLSSQPLFGSDAETLYGVVTTFTQLVGVGGEENVVEVVEERQPLIELKQIQRQQHEITQRQGIESRLVAVNNQLEQVEARTTQLSQALAALGESAALYRTLAKNFPNGAVVLFDFNLRYLLVEGEELILVGVSNQEIVGKTIWEILPEETCAILEPIYRQALAGETTLTEIPNNNYIYSMYALPVKNEQGEIFAGMVMTQNITERKRVEAELQKSHQSLTATLESITDAILTLDAEWRFTYVNHQATLLLQRERNELIGKCIWDEFPEAVNSVFYQQYHRAILGQVPVKFTEMYSPLNGWYEVRAYPTGDGLTVYFQDISDHLAALKERKQSETALRESEERIRVATTAAEVGMWFWDITINKLVWTPKCKALFGLTADTEISYDLFLERLHPDDRSPTHTAVTQALNQKADYDIEYRCVWNDGSIHWIAAKGRAFYDNMGQPVRMMGTVQDISDRKLAEEALRQSELNFRTLADTMPQIIWTAQPDGWLDYYNQRWYDYTGMNLEQTQGWGWDAVLHPDDIQNCIGVWSESVRTGKDYQIEYRFRRASDGQYRWHLGRAFPLRNENGQIVKWFGSGTDIDDNKRTEVTLQDALQQQQLARKEAEKANRIKDEFLAILSHELRSPLNPILGWSKLLLADKLNPKQTRQAIETIERNAKLQIDLIDDLLDVSRILRGKLTLNITSVNLNSIITAASETVNFAAQAKKIELVTILEPNIEKAQGDPARLQQVVLNLLSNAIKFTPNGGRIEVKLVQVGNVAHITVTDNGKGISPEFLPSMFDYFRQEDSSITRKFGGLGLGLAIVRQIVELHGGTVKADSPGLERGATFTVMLPLMVSEPEIADRDSQEFPNESLNLSGIRVLVVDDENDSQYFIGFTLQQYGASVTAVASASEALQILALFKPDVLVSDIGMPGMDGYALIREIRSCPVEQGGRVPAIAVTAYAGEYDQRQAINAGFQVHVSKPVEPEVLAAAVGRLGRGG